VCAHFGTAAFLPPRKKGNDSMNAMELNFMPGARGLYALASRAPGAYKVALAGRHVVWRSGRAF
jgi:hypothetical protein